MAMKAESKLAGEAHLTAARFFSLAYFLDEKEGGADRLSTPPCAAPA